MSDFVENSFPINNDISISNRINNNIPYFFMYFNSIHSFTNFNKDYKRLPDTSRNIIQREIKYKLISYIHQDYKVFYFTSNNFLKSLHHLFFSLRLLHSNNIYFTINNIPFIHVKDNNLPVLMDFSYSFNSSSFNVNNMKLFFSPSLLENKYIAIDVYIITYLINNSITIFDATCCETIIEQYTSCRENINKERLFSFIHIFNNYDANKIIKYLCQFKSSWSYYSFCYYFICNYSNLLSDNALLVSFYIYINSSFKERDNNIINLIHNQLFDI